MLELKKSAHALTILRQYVEIEFENDSLNIMILKYDRMNEIWKKNQMQKCK